MNRPRAQRILGMTIPQLLILGCLTLSIICTFVGGYWALNTVVASAYAIPILPGLNATPLPTSTPAPTATLLPTASPTPITYESLIPAGWKQFKSETAPGMEIWLPPSYILQTEQDQKTSIPILQGADDEALRTILLLKDTTSSPYLIFTTFEMDTRTVFASDLEAMIDAEFGTLMRSGRLSERDVFEFVIGDTPARRLIFDINVSGVNGGLAIYVVQVGQDVWYLSFATAFNELYTRLPVFDQIAQTFRVKP
jgi:hypothetical protein